MTPRLECATDLPGRRRTVALRPATAREADVIARQWRTEFKPRGHELEDGDRYIRIGHAPREFAISPRLWHEVHREVVRELVEAPFLAAPRSSTVLAVAHFESVPDVMLGWACYEPGNPAVVHFVHVNEDDRKHGLGTALFRGVLERIGAPVRYSHMTPLGRRLVAAVARASEASA